jgi:hypothetical protein
MRAWRREKTTEDRWEDEVRPGANVGLCDGRALLQERCAESALDTAGGAAWSLAGQASGLVTTAGGRQVSVLIPGALAVRWRCVGGALASVQRVGLRDAVGE